ncbi:MAG: class I SAM-dependent methyltransferase [Limisphaerales bacterium]
MSTQCQASEHYQAERGKVYFAAQNRFAALGAKLDVRKFASLVQPTDRVLDFGCAGGWLLRELVCREKVGIEINEQAHPICKANQVKVYKFISEVVERDFDVIISHHCLEHVPNPIEALCGLRDLLSPNGKLVIAVPIDDWRAQTDHTAADPDHHLHTWTPRLMTNTLVGAGFTPLKIKIITHSWFRGWPSVYGKIPQTIFDLLCWMHSVIRKRRQLFVYAKKA